mmetsp:Transcript_115347/g.333211  ORF Transcript_115347/g.333211 Transcript_115347/m.333211 type:complete len:218 (+) Transcript_115347:688-1341(+)
MLDEDAVETSVTWVLFDAEHYAVCRDVQILQQLGCLVLDEGQVVRRTTESEYDAHRRGLGQGRRAMEINVLLRHGLFRQPELALEGGLEVALYWVGTSGMRTTVCFVPYMVPEVVRLVVHVPGECRQRSGRRISRALRAHARPRRSRGCLQRHATGSVCAAHLLNDGGGRGARDGVGCGGGRRADRNPCDGPLEEDLGGLGRAVQHHRRRRCIARDH